MYPAYQEGDVAITVRDNDNPAFSFDNLKNGDVITYHTYAFDPNWAPDVNVMHRVVDSYTFPDTGQKVYITKGDNNQDTHAYIDYPICEGYFRGKVVAKIPWIALPRVWSQTYEQVVDDEQLPSYNQQQVILERTAGCKYYYNE
jgi:hypothetical protein